MKLNQPKVLIVEEGFLRKDIETFLRSKKIDTKLVSLNPNISLNRNTYIDKLLNIFFRVFKKDIYYYQQKEINYKSEFYLRELKKEIKNDKFDYVLLIIPYHYSKKMVNHLSKQTNVIVAYSWESINSMKEHQLKKISSKIDKMFCFDKNSIDNYSNLNLNYTTNFYYPLVEIENLKDKPLLNESISYVGNLADRRDLKIEEILDFINQEINKNIVIVSHDIDKNVLSQKYNFNYVDAGISLHDYLKITLDSTIILDIQAGWQNGFTFRIFEASYLKKKIITTNQNAKELKFYHPNNIFIYNDKTKHLLNDFIQLPYTEIDSELMEYYRIDNWLKRILEIN